MSHLPRAARPTVAFNALFLHFPFSGTGRYVQQIVRLADRWVDLALLGARVFPPVGETVGGSPVRLLQTPVDSLPRPLAKVWLEQVALAHAARQTGAALLHYPYFAAPIVSGLPIVTTVHDLVPLIQSEYRRTVAQRLYTGLVTAGLRRAARVITDSAASARDLRERLGLPESQIRVIPLAVDDRFRPLSGEADATWAQSVRARLGIAGPYFLYVGGFDRRKNVERLLQAFARFKRSGTPPHALVLVGARRAGESFFYDPLPDVEHLGLRDSVILAGRVGDDDVRALQTGADAFVFPSLYEGFGLPPLEAMACGAPVIAANTSSLPEVVGEAGLLIDPTSVDELAQALARLAGDPELRRELGQRARSRAAGFTWEATVEATANVYREVAACR
jgi:glycosyltransferase involved in cell wall biosynthesis